MSRHVIAVYPGTFDPITLGHEDIVRRAAGLFDQVIIAVAMAHHKKTLFTLDERLELARDTASRYDNVSVEPFDGLVRDFVVDRGGKVMVRGVRGVTDFDFEFGLAGMNRNLAPDVETIFMTPAATWHPTWRRWCWSGCWTSAVPAWPIDLAPPDGIGSRPSWPLTHRRSR